ncbi:MAG: glutamate racemase [Anaerolineales bacterium]
MAEEKTELMVNHDPNLQTPIGIFDSGVGGLSVLKAIRQQLPHEKIIFIADQTHVPYGPRPLEEVRAYSEAITRFLLGEGAKVIVVACNTASAAALLWLRQTFPEVPFVGMEPALKPAAETTQSGVVGVLATPATFQGALYASVVERFAQGVKVLQHTCPGLVAQIEAGRMVGPEARAILEAALQPMLAQSIDTIVLGCTHYPFVIPLIEEITGPTVRVIDPAPAVARQTRRVLEARGVTNPRLETNLNNKPDPIYYTTGQPELLSQLLPILLGETGQVSQLVWQADKLVKPTPF